jgi:hypothetical protein
MTHPISVKPRKCPSKINDAMYDHPSSCFKIGQFCKDRNSSSSPMLLGQTILQNGSTVSETLPHSMFICVSFSFLEVNQNVFWLLFYHAVSILITFNLKFTVYEIYISLLHIQKTSLF